MANKLPSLIFIGMCVGGPLLSFIAEKTKHYWTTIIYSGIVTIGSFGLLIFSRPGVFVISTLFFLIGICCAYQILAIYKISTYTSERAVGLTTAITNMIIMLFGYFFHNDSRKQNNASTAIRALSHFPLNCFVIFINLP